MKLRVLTVGLVLAGCSPTMDELPKLSDQDVAQSSQSIGVVPSGDADAPLGDQSDVQAAIAAADIPAAEPSTNGGLFGVLRRALPNTQDARTPDPDRIAAIAPKTEVLPQRGLTIDKPASTAVLPLSTDVAEGEIPATSQDDVASQIVPVVATAPVAQKPKGLFGLLRRAPATEQDPAQGLLDPDKAEVIAPRDQTLPSAPQEFDVAAVAPQPTARRGLFTPRKPSLPTGPDAAQVPLGTKMPYGSIARVCGANRGSLGREIGKFPDRGRGYKLYDSNPGSTAMRPHYITGFEDGCVRQFSAALAMFGGTEFHEQVRYQKTSRDFPYTQTDLAYEKLKSQVCLVGRNTPCPPNRVDKLQKDTVFITVYERFGNNPRWASILLHDGNVLTKSIKSR